MDAEKARREALAAIGCDWRNHPAEHTAEKHLAVACHMRGKDFVLIPHPLD